MFGVRPVVIGFCPRARAQGSNTNHHSKRGARCQCDEYLFDVHLVSPMDGSRYDNRTDKRTVGPDKRSGKLQSTAGREIRRHAVQYRGLPRPGFNARIAWAHPVMGWSALWTILRTAQTAHPIEPSMRTGSTRGKKSRRI